MDWAQPFFQKYPELAVYLALGVGYAIGGLKLGGFSLGGSTGSLLAGLLIGAFLEVPVAATAKSVLFMLFLFGIGYSVGPKFAKAMKGDGWRFAVLGVFVPVVGLLTAWAWRRSFASIRALPAGSCPARSPSLLRLGPRARPSRDWRSGADEKQRLVGHVAVADALCYVFGAFGVIWVCGNLGPRLLKLDLRKEAEQLERQLGIEPNRPARSRPGGHSGCAPSASRPRHPRPGAPPRHSSAARILRGSSSSGCAAASRSSKGAAPRAAGRGCRRGLRPSRGARRSRDARPGRGRGPRAAAISPCRHYRRVPDGEGPGRSDRRRARQSRTGIAGRLPAQDRPQRTGGADRPWYHARAW